MIGETGRARGRLERRGLRLAHHAHLVAGLNQPPQVDVQPLRWHSGAKQVLLAVGDNAQCLARSLRVLRVKHILVAHRSDSVTRD